jgi:hypothetical protein
MSHAIILRLILMVAATLTMGTVPPNTAAAADALTRPQRVEAIPALELPYRALPPRDCLHCWGPMAGPPPVCCHHRFVYYGTSPLGDDPVNGFNDCPKGTCGCHAVNLSLRWISIRERCAMSR